MSTEPQNDGEGERPLHGEYPVRVHLAGDGAVFCTLIGHHLDTVIPENIEDIETAVFRESPQTAEPNLETILTPEGEREEPAPTVGTAVYDDGEMTELELDDVPGGGA